MTTDAPTRRIDRQGPAADLLVFVLTAGVLLSTSIKPVLDAPIPDFWRVLDLVGIGLLQATPVTARRRPVATFIAAAVAMLILSVSPHLITNGEPVPAALVPSAILFFYPLYFVSLRESSRRALAALAVSLVGAALVSWRLATGPDWTSKVAESQSSWPILAATAVFGSAASWAMGRLRSTRNAYLAELEARARRTEADRAREAEEAAIAERQRIARELHDVISHSLAVMVSQAEGGRMIAADRQTGEVLTAIASTGRQALTDMRSMVGVLRDGPSARDEPAPTIDRIADLIDTTRTTGLPVTFNESGNRREAAPSAQQAAYRIVQESLTNVIKHAGPDATASVSLDWSPEDARLTIHNKGTRDRQPGGSGLNGIAERAQAVGGTAAFGPTDDGWQVDVHLPLQESG